MTIFDFDFVHKTPMMVEEPVLVDLGYRLGYEYARNDEIGFVVRRAVGTITWAVYTPIECWRMTDAGRVLSQRKKEA